MGLGLGLGAPCARGAYPPAARLIRVRVGVRVGVGVRVRVRMRVSVSVRVRVRVRVRVGVSVSVSVRPTCVSCRLCCTRAHTQLRMLSGHTCTARCLVSIRKALVRVG